MRDKTKREMMLSHKKTLKEQRSKNTGEQQQNTTQMTIGANARKKVERAKSSTTAIATLGGTAIG